MPNKFHRTGIASLSMFVTLAVACLCSPATLRAGSGINAVPFIQLPLSPTSVRPGSSAFSLTVTGTGFAAGSVVNWNGSSRTTSFVSATELTASVPASDVVKATTASITVFTPGPGGGTSNVVFLHVINQEPSVGLGVKGACTSIPSLAADFNGDGKLDLVGLDSVFAGNATVLLGNGDGTFQVRAKFNTGEYPQGVTTADFNGDGKLDLAITSGSVVDIFLGNGDGTFTAKGTINAGNGPELLVAGDFNEDGWIDLAVTDEGDGSVLILLGNGDGTFRVGSNIPIGSSIYPIAVGDFNDDGHLDLVVANGFAPGTVSVLLGNGDGSFQNPIPTVVQSGGSDGLAVADLNGDGKLDLVVPDAASDSVIIFLGNGDGTFGNPLANSLVSPRAVAIGDFNGDNKLDLAIAQTGNLSTSVLLGKGDGSFGPPVTYFSSIPGSVVVGDFNRDGRLDMDQGCVFLQTPRAVTTSRASLDFPEQEVGTSSSPKQVKLTNTGTQTVSISNIGISGDFSQSNNCPATLDIFKGCMITVTFTPTTTGTRTGALTIADDAAGNPQTLSLTGTGVD